MAVAETVYSNLTQDHSVHGGLFKHLSFWVAARTPLRATYLETIRSNGGEIVRLEQHADVLIADHLRPDAPPGSLSFKWLEACVREGRLVDKEFFPAGRITESPRPVGSSRSVRQGRTNFTPDDDRILWSWVKTKEQQGAKVLGNEIYKQLGAQNKRHPWQAWRDRWVRHVSKHAPTNITLSTPPTPPSETNVPDPVQRHSASTAGPVNRDCRERSQNTPEDRHKTHDHPSRHVDALPASSKPSEIMQESLRSTTRMSLPAASTPPPRSSQSPAQQRGPRKSFRQSGNSIVNLESFSEEDYTRLFNAAPIIENTPIGNYQGMWEDLAKNLSAHGPEDWQKYYETVVYPDWKKESHLHLREDVSADTQRLFSGSQSAGLGYNSGEHVSQDVRDIVGNITTSTPTLQAAGSVSPNQFFDAAQSPPRDDHGSPSRKKRSSDAVEGDRPRKRHQTSNLDVGLIEDELPHGQAPFTVYESQALPEGEKENVVFNEAGYPSFPPPHVHTRTEDALQAFTDPPIHFKLQESDETSPERGNAIQEDDWQGIHNPTTDAADDDLDTSDEGRQEDFVQDNGGGTDPELEFPTNYALHENAAPVVSLRYDTQMILDGETQLPDFGMPAPPANESYDPSDEDALAERYRVTRRSRSQSPAWESEIAPGELEDDEDFDFDEITHMPFPESYASVDEYAPSSRESRDQQGFGGPQTLQDDEDGHELQFDEWPPTPSPERRNPLSGSFTDGHGQLPPRTSNATNFPSLPIPPSSDITATSENKRPWRSPSRSSSPAVDPETEEDLIASFIKEQEDEGHAYETVVIALEATNLDGELAKRVIASIEEGRGIPHGVRGIFTEADDKVLTGSVARDMRKLELFHGAENFRMRREFLREWGRL